MLWSKTLIRFFPTMRVVYLSYAVSFFLMLFMLVPMYRRYVKQAEASR